MSELFLAVEAGDEDGPPAPVCILNPAILKAIVLYLDTYPDLLKLKVLAALGPSLLVGQKEFQSKEP